MNNQKIPSKIKVRDDNNERVTSWQWDWFVNDVTLLFYYLN